MPGDLETVRPTAASTHAGSGRRLGAFLIAAATTAAIQGPWGSAALAAPPVLQAPSDETFQPDQTGGQTSGLSGFFNGIGKRELLLGDMGGLRTELSKYGISFALQETSEVLGNVTGGSRRAAAYDGLTQMLVQLDTDRAFGWHGGTFNASALQIHGTDLSGDTLLTLQTSSGITAERSTRLWELWYQQKFLDEDRLDVKIGQQSLDQEFMVSQNANLFLNTMFGWAMVPSADLPGGGPAYPLSALGVRARARPVDSLTFLAGVFNGSPSPSTVLDAQMANPSGTSFPLNGGVLLIAEMQYSYPAMGTMLNADQPEPLARTYKLGVWWDSENFADQQFDNMGLSLANPASNGLPRNHHGDFGVYAVADQLVWVDPKESDHTISLFARFMGAPQADRNLITFSLNAGVTLHEPIRHRDNDTLGFGMGFTKVSGSASALDQATATFNNSFVPRRTSETFLEVTYQYEVAPWWQLQPDIQYVFNPGGGVENPNDLGTTVKNELIFGLRTNILF